MSLLLKLPLTHIHHPLQQVWDPQTITASSTHHPVTIKHSSSWTSQCGVGPKQKGYSSSRRAPTIAYTTSVSFTDDRGPPIPGGRHPDGADGEHDQAEWAEAGWMGGGGLLNRHSPINIFERLLVRCITPTYTCTYTLSAPRSPPHRSDILINIL